VDTPSELYRYQSCTAKAFRIRHGRKLLSMNGLYVLSKDGFGILVAKGKHLGFCWYEMKHRLCYYDGPVLSRMQRVLDGYVYIQSFVYPLERVVESSG